MIKIGHMVSYTLPKKGTIVGIVDSIYGDKIHINPIGSYAEIDVVDKATIITKEYRLDSDGVYHDIDGCGKGKVTVNKIVYNLQLCLNCVFPES